MMGRALLVIGWIGLVGLAAAGISGYRVTDLNTLNTHVLVALLACLLLLFSHCWILFYLIGTGKVIKNAVAEHGLEASIVEQTRQFKNRTNPWLMSAMTLAIATFVLGAGAHAQTVPAWFHHVLFYLTLVVQIVTLRLEYGVLVANERIIVDVGRRVTT